MPCASLPNPDFPAGSAPDAAPRRRSFATGRNMLLAGALLIVSAVSAPAQELPIKRNLPMIEGSPCPALPAPAPVSAADAEEAARLASSASQATILGDFRTARELLSRAARLDPTAEHIAYLLGRALEELGETDAALAEYCRYLALAPDAPGAPEARQSIDRIAAQARLAVSQDAADAFRAGIAAFDARDYGEADRQFTRAATLEPTWADALYNRGVVRLARGQGEDALADLNRYLVLQPGAPEAEAIQVLALRMRPVNVTYDRLVAFGLGAIPGAGHFYTDRPIAGMIVLAGAGTAAGLGLALTKETVECLVIPVGKTCPDNQVRNRVTERPYLYHGLAAAAAITLIGAIDAMRGAGPGDGAATLRVGGSEESPLRLHLLPAATGTHLPWLRLEF